MENKEEKKRDWKKGLAIYILAGLIWATSQNFIKSTNDQLVVLVVAMLGAYSFHYINKKMRPAKWITLKRSFAFVGIWLLCGFLVGFLTAII